MIERLAGRGNGSYIDWPMTAAAGDSFTNLMFDDAGRPDARLARDSRRLAVIRARRAKAAGDYFRQKRGALGTKLSSLYVDEGRSERVLVKMLGD